MIITHNGKISSDFYVIGPPVAPIYLLDGEEPVLFDGGFTALSYQYESALKEILIDRSPAHLCITHSHFDHIGAVSYLKSIWPGLKIYASEKCRNILSKDSAVQLIKQLSIDSTKGLQEIFLSQICEKPFESFNIDILIHSNQRISFSPGLSVMAIDTPGHTWDFKSYYIPERKIFIASEAVAVYEGHDDIQTEFLVDAGAYLKSLKKIRQFDIKILCAGHYAIFTDDDALNHIDKSIRATKEYQMMVEKLLFEEKGDVDRIVSKIKNMEWVNRPVPKQSEAAYTINTQQRVKSILKNLN